MSYVFLAPFCRLSVPIYLFRIEGQTYLLAATTDGYLYCYSINPQTGECQPVKQHKIGPHKDSKGDDGMCVGHKYDSLFFHQLFPQCMLPL